MAFKPNYGLQRAERTRAKQAKAQEKLKNRQARANADPDAEQATPDAGTRDSD